MLASGSVGLRAWAGDDLPLRAALGRELINSHGRHRSGNLKTQYATRTTANSITPQSNSTGAGSPSRIKLTHRPAARPPANRIVVKRAASLYLSLKAA